MNISENEKKYQTKNVLKKALLGNFLKKIRNIIYSLGAKNILDAGCGEGYIISYLKNDDKSLAKRGLAIKGLDLSEKSVKKASKIIGKENVFAGDIYNMPFKDNSFDLVLALEVLEHLTSPEKAIKEIKRVTKKYVLISVPNEPFFSYGNLLFGKNIKRFGRDREHFNFWNKKDITSLVSRHFSVKRVESPFPWTVILAKK